MIKEFVTTNCVSELMKLAKESNSMIFAQKKAPSAKDIGKRAQNMWTKLSPVLNQLSAACNEGMLSEQLCGFLGTLIQNDSVIPNGFLTEYEIWRLDYSFYGTAKNFTADRYKMIYAFQFLIRYFIPEIILKPWVYETKLKEKNANLRNMLNVSSVIYHILMDMFDNLPKYKLKDNEDISMLPVATNLNITAFAPGTKVKLDVEPDGSVRDIQGLYSKSQLADFFSTQTQIVSEIRNSLEKILDNIHSTIDKFRTRKHFVVEGFGKYIYPKYN